MNKRRIPTKVELLQLQKLYRTDKRIGQALGGVSEQLVAYWRRKKGVGKSVFPKYSFMEIKELWERFGDDDKAGVELQITKQAFYRWRKKYKLLERPTILKLEQLEFRFFDEQRLSRSGNSENPAQTYFQKIASYHVDNRFVKINESVEIRADLAVTLDNDGIHVFTGEDEACFASFEEMFAGGYFRPGRVIISNSPEATTLAVTNSLVQLSQEAVISSAAYPRTVSLKIVPAIRIALTGAQQIRHTPFDSACCIAEAIDLIGKEDFCLQLGGTGIDRLAIEERMSLLAYTRLLTNRHVVIEPDQTFLNYVSQYGASRWPVPFSDKHVFYLDDLNVTVSRTRSLIYSLVHRQFVTDFANFHERILKRIRIGPVLGGTLEDFRAIAAALKDGPPRTEVELYVLPQSKAVFVEALRRKYVQKIVEAGAFVANCRVLPSLAKLNSREFELTTEINNTGDSSYLASVQTIANVLPAGKLTKRSFESPSSR